MELVGLNFTCVIVTVAAVNFAPMIVICNKVASKFSIGTIIAADAQAVNK